MIDDYGVINDSSPHIIADLFEIIALFERKSMSRGDVETYLINEAGRAVEDDMDDAAGAGASSAEKNEKFQKLSEEVFVHLSYRQAALGEWYPFIVDSDVIEPKDDLTTERIAIYAALLVYSRLRMVSRSRRVTWAGNFEKLSVEAVKGMFPGWEVIHFGKGGADRAAFGNKLKNALPRLAEKMKDLAISGYIDELAENNMGDAGVDIIALQTFDDPAAGVGAYLGQCAAQTDTWPEKKFEASAETLSQFIQFFHYPGKLMIIPVFFRNPDGKWVDSRASYSSIVLDRLRLIRLLERGEAAALTAARATIPPALIAAIPAPV